MSQPMNISRRTWLGAVLGAQVGATIAPWGALRATPAAALTARQRMLEAIDADFFATRDSTGREAMGPLVRPAMERVARDQFVPPEYAARAWDNRPLPIGHGQTISQPFIVALMTELLQVTPGDRVLEVGTGSGYQAAVLAEIAARVYTIEIVAPLAQRARTVLAALGYRNIEFRVGDGYAGWPEEAPFDAVIVTAAPDHVPKALFAQLKRGGRMVIPVGAHGAQRLLVLSKDSDGRPTTSQTIEVRFVPLTRAQ